MLYHSDIYIPEYAQRPCFVGRLTYGPHALYAAQTDRYGQIELPETFKAACAQLIEVEVDARQRIVKQVWRTRLDEKRDLVLAIEPDGFVRTVWINLRSDTHMTLNKARYMRAPRARLKVAAKPQ